MTSVYSKAVSLGYPFRWGEGRSSGDVWMTRFQKTNEPNDTDFIYVGWDHVNGRWVIEHE